MKRHRLLAAILAFALSAPAFAESAIQAKSPNYEKYVGVLLGLTTADHDVGGGLGYGLQGAYFLTKSVGVGLTVMGGEHTDDISQFTYLLEGLYRLDSILPGLTGGIQLGASKFSKTGGDNGFNVAYGFKAAYDHFLSADGSGGYRLSVGGQASLDWVKPGSELLTVFSPMATAKIWF